MGRVMAVVSSCSVCLGAVTLQRACSSPGCVWAKDWQCVTCWHVPIACLLDNKMCLKEWGSQGKDSWHSISANSLSWTGGKAWVAATGAKRHTWCSEIRGFLCWSSWLHLLLGFVSIPPCAAPPRDLQGLSIPAFQRTKKRQIDPWVKTDPRCLSGCLYTPI